MKKLTFSMENYLESIYELSNDKTGARVSDIAERLGVTKASTNNAMSTLAEKGLIINEKYQSIFLTKEGYHLAQLISKKHKVVKQFFTDVLNINEDVADQDACAIEHVISDDSIYAMEEFLNQNKKI